MESLDLGVGAGFLAHNLDLIQINVFQLLRVWWPAILILLGIGMFFTKDSNDAQNKQDNQDKK